MNTNVTNGSQEYIYLNQRLDSLKANFRVDDFKNIQWDLLDDVKKDYARAYISLCHTEIEYYLEQRASSIVSEALYLWKSNKTVSLPLLALFAHFEFIEKSFSTNEKINMITRV